MKLIKIFFVLYFFCGGCQVKAESIEFANCDWLIPEGFQLTEEKDKRLIRVEPGYFAGEVLFLNEKFNEALLDSEFIELDKHLKTNRYEVYAYRYLRSPEEKQLGVSESFNIYTIAKEGFSIELYNVSSQELKTFSEQCLVLPDDF